MCRGENAYAEQLEKDAAAIEENIKNVEEKFMNLMGRHLRNGKVRIWVG